jgi:hypothetical protein
MNRTMVAAALTALGAVLAAPVLTAGPAHAASLPSDPGGSLFPDVFKSFDFPEMSKLEFPDFSSGFGEISGGLMKSFGKGFGHSFSTGTLYVRKTMPNGEVTEIYADVNGGHRLVGPESGEGR